MVGAVAERAEQLEDPRRDVGAARVEHRVVVGERDLGQDLVVDVDVEGRPAAVAVLHREQPVDPAAGRRARPRASSASAVRWRASRTIAVSSMSG